MMIQIIDATEEHARAIAPHLMPSCEEELCAGFKTDPETTLIGAIEIAEEAKTVIVDGVPVMLFGIFRNDNSASPWLVASVDAEKHKIQLVRASVVWVREKLQHYGRLENYVYAGNTKAQCWLRWLGFTLEERQPMGDNNQMFIRYWREA